MESLALGLFEGHEIVLLSLPDALDLQRDVVVSVRQAMDASVEHEPLVVKRAQSTFLGLEMIGFMKYMGVSQIDVKMSTESMSVNLGKIAAHSYLDPVDLVVFSPEATISDEVLFCVLEIGHELVMSYLGLRYHLESVRPLLPAVGQC